MIDESCGKYVYVIASDDIAKPNAIKVLSDFLEKHEDYVQAVGDNEVIDEFSKKVFVDKNCNVVYDCKQTSPVFESFAKYLMYLRPDVNFYSDEFGKYETFIEGGNYIPNGNMFLRSTLLAGGKYNKNAPLDDLHINLQMSQRGKIKFIDEILFSYRRHSGNTSLDLPKLACMSHQTILYQLFYAPKTQEAINVINKFTLYKRTNFFLFQIEKYRSQIKRKKYLNIFGKKLLLKTADIYKNV
jgi:alpha-1,3-rhamnosyltransferase